MFKQLFWFSAQTRSQTHVIKWVVNQLAKGYFLFYSTKLLNGNISLHYDYQEGPNTLQIDQNVLIGLL